jgi:glycerophosphoryl diester phosphodiesterase
MANRLCLSLLIPVFTFAGCARESTPDARAVTVIAHRGASYHAPEHTFFSWDRALELGADWIEQDLQLTRDSVLVVLHDASLDRTARGPANVCRGPVRARSWAELHECEVGTWFNERDSVHARPEFVGARIPSLEEVFARYASRAGARFYIETKVSEQAPGMEEALLALLRRFRLAGEGADAGRVMVQSFSFASLERMRALDSAVPLVYLLSDTIPADSLRAEMARIARVAVGIGPSRRVVDAQMVEAAHEAGLAVHPYTVNDPDMMRALLALGVDGMFTDRPALLRNVLAEPGAR